MIDKIAKVRISQVKHILKLGYSEKGYDGWLEGLPSPLREHIVNGDRICDIVNEWDKLWAMTFD